MLLADLKCWRAGGTAKRPSISYWLEGLRKGRIRSRKDQVRTRGPGEVEMALVLYHDPSEAWTWAWTGQYLSSKQASVERERKAAEAENKGGGGQKRTSQVTESRESQTVTGPPVINRSFLVAGRKSRRTLALIAPFS